MAQQITNMNNSILDVLSDTKLDYTDNSSNAFDSALESAVNKTISSNNSEYTFGKRDLNKTLSDKKTFAKDSVKDSTSDKNINVSQEVGSSRDDKNVIDNKNEDIKDSSKVSEDTEDVKDTKPKNSNIIDLVSKYTYFEDESTLSDSLVDATEDLDTLSELTSETLVSDIDVDSSVLNAEAAGLAAQAPLLGEVSEVGSNDVNSAQIEVSENIQIENLDLEELGEGQSKDLISQDILDELNVTLEDITTLEDSSDSNLMTTAEQAVKYVIDKNSTEETDLAVDSVLEDEGLVDTTITAEDLSEANETLIANNDENLSVSQDGSEKNEVTETSSEQIEVNDGADSSSTDENSYLNNHDKSDRKENLKKESMKSDNIDDIPDIEQSTSKDLKYSNLQGDISVGKANSVSGISQSNLAPTSSAQNMQPVNISKEDVIAQIHNKLQALNSTTNTKLTMVLNPESLGKVQIQLANSREGVTAEFLVSSQGVKDILDSSLTQLKETLSAQGVHVNDVSVKVSTPQNPSQMDYTEQEGSNSNKQNQEGHQQREKDEQGAFDDMFSSSLEEGIEENN